MPTHILIMSSNIKLFTATASQSLAESIAHHFGQPLGEVSLVYLAMGVEPSLMKRSVGVMCLSLQSPSFWQFDGVATDDRRCQACFDYNYGRYALFWLARQDKKGKPRVPIGAKLVANLLTAAGVDRVMTMDLHADQIQGFFEVPVDHMFASTLFVPYIQSLGLSNLCMASPDMGGTKRANTYAKYLETEVVVCYKHRDKANEISKMLLIGDVKGKDIILVDDMVDTAGTLTKAADLLIENGAKSVRACCTHAILSGNAYERIDNSQLEELIVTDSLKKEHKSKKVKVIEIGNLFANTIKSVLDKKSISSSFIN